MAGRPLSTEESLMMGFSFNKRLARNLERLRAAVLSQDFDCIILIDGKEGGGKSVLAQHVAAFLDITRRIDQEQIVFTPEQFTEKVLNSEKGKAIIWDEARGGLNRRKSMDDVNIQITDMLAEIRQRNLFIIIVMPSFYDMDMNVAVWRSRALIHIWYDWESGDARKPLRRGFFRFYNEEGKKKLYTDKLTRMRYAYPYLKNHCFDATFPNHYCVDEEEYRKRKADALRSYSKKNDPYKCPTCQRKALKGKNGMLKCPLGHEWPEKLNEV